MLRLLLLLAALLLASCSRSPQTPAGADGASATGSPSGPADAPGASAIAPAATPAERLAALRARRDGMTQRQGAAAIGESQVQFTAWYDGDAVAMIEVDDDLGEIGHMVTTYAYAGRDLYRVEAKGELRRNEPGRPNFLDPMQYAIDFGGGGGSGSGTWGPDPLTDIAARAGMAVETAELLRRAAEGLKGS